MNEYFKNNCIKNISKEQTIYKFIPFKFIKLILNNKTIVASRTDSWDDPYENFFYNCIYKSIDGTSVTARNLNNCIFGQCWTTKEESDAMWRIYSDLKTLDDCAIRVKTDVKRLFDVFYTDDSCMATHTIGSVTYLSQNDIETEFRERTTKCKIIKDLAEVAKESMFIKRNEFSHENEVRIIINIASDDKKRYGAKNLTYKIDPSFVFDEFCIDPRLKATEFTNIKNELITLGVDSKKIIQSSLYKFNALNIALNF